METHIENLNKATETRQKMIDDIIYWKHSPKTDAQADKLELKYQQKSFADLKKLFENLKKSDYV